MSFKFDPKQANIDPQEFKDGKGNFLDQKKRIEAFVVPYYAPTLPNPDVLISVFIDTYVLLNTLSNKYDVNKIYPGFEGVMFWLCYDDQKKILFWAVQAKEHRNQVGRYLNGLFLNDEASHEGVSITSMSNLKSCAKKVQGAKKDFDTLKGPSIQNEFTFHTYSLLRLITSETSIDPKTPSLTVSCLLLEVKDVKGNYLDLGYKYPDKVEYIAGQPCPPLCYYQKKKKRAK